MSNVRLHKRHPTMPPPFDPSDMNFGFSVSGDALLDASGKLRRAQFLASKIDKTGVYFLQDGTITQRLFVEASETFAAGQFMATIILGFSFIERTIAGRLSYLGKTKEAQARSEQLLSTAREAGWLTPEEHERLEELRHFRNPVVHFRDPLDESRPEVQALLAAKTTEEYLEKQAREIMVAAIHVLNTSAI